MSIEIPRLQVHPYFSRSGLRVHHFKTRLHRLSVHVYADFFVCLSRHVPIDRLSRENIQLVLAKYSIQSDIS